VQHVIATPFPAIPTGIFLGNKEAVPDKHSVSFHQDISQMEQRYGGKWSSNMLALNCWTLVWEISKDE
jgi:hypothetical protein